MLSAHERSIEIEKRIFSELRQTILQAAGRIRLSSGVIAEVDLLANFAHLAALRNYVRPQLASSAVLETVGARHPVVECCWRRLGRPSSSPMTFLSRPVAPACC